MSFKEQLRNWLACSSEDFWRVHPSKLWGAAMGLLVAIGYATWRIFPLYSPAWRSAEHTLSPFTALLGFLLLGFSFYRRIRRFIQSIR